ncbi:MAG: helix-turn-helix transcriptional regulator [Flavobacteriaceae bacterium]|nr:helix-turn-helix transcriptional regulator [Flavobacteriaceae bacterium]
MKFLLLFTVFFIHCSVGFCQLDKVTAPFITSFNISEMGVRNVEQLKQAENGLYYMATSKGLLETDGVNHFLYRKGKLTNLTSIYIFSDKLIYSAGIGGFGLWEKNEYGRFEYTSLHYVAPTKEDYLQPIFSNIVSHENHMVFKSQDQLFFFNPKDGNITTLKAPEYYKNIFKTSSYLFFSDFQGSIYTIQGDDMTLFDDFKQTVSDLINVFEIAQNDFVFIFKNGQVWSKKGTSTRNVANLKSIVINTAIRNKNNQIVIGTNQNGIYILDNQFRPKKTITDTDGLQSNYINGLYEDAQENLWAISDKVIHNIKQNNVVHYIKESKNQGQSHGFILHNNLFLNATNQGLFSTDIRSKSSLASLVKNSQGVNWHIEKIDNTVFVGHEKGIFIYERDNSLRLLHPVNGVWDFKQHDSRKDLIYCGTYNGILILKKNNGKWSFYKRLDGFYDSSRFMEFDSNYLWVCHPAKGFFKLGLSDNLENIKSFEFLKNFDSDDELFYNYFFKLNDALIFYNPQGFYKYDDTDKAFYKSSAVTELFKGISDLSFVKQLDNSLWFSTNKHIGLFDLELRKSTLFKNKKIKTLGDFSKFKRLNEKYVLFNSEDQVFVFNEEAIARQGRDSVVQKPLIKTVKFVGINDTIQHTIVQDNIKSFPYASNSLSIQAQLPNYLGSSTHVVEYKVNDEGKWFEADDNLVIKINGLETNNYKFYIRTNDQQGNFSDNIEFEFKIQPKWYLSTAAFMIYAVLTMGFFLIVTVRQEIRNKKKSERLIKKEKRKQKERINRLELQKLKDEKTMLALEQDKLQLEIKNRNQELAFTTYNNIKKNDLLINLKNHIFKLNDVKKGKELSPKMRSIVKRIDIDLKETYDWVKFEFHFKKSNPNFFSKLDELHPDLTPNDIRICAFIKLNIPNKQMASLLNINPKSLEMTRYRLRKKLGLAERSDLYNYICSL